MPDEDQTPQSLRRLAADLDGASRALDKARVDTLCDALIDALRQREAPAPIDVAAYALDALRRQRFFRPMRRLADALIQTGQDAPLVRRQYAQALIERGAISAAVAVLRQLAQDVPAGGGEHAQARGLLGRAFKQQYVAAGRARAERLRDALGSAVEWYYESYRADPDRSLWHGINAVACVARARRDGVALRGAAQDLDERRLAEDVLGRVSRELADPAAPADVFAVATALEACVALGDARGAAGYAARYADHPEARAFELGSTLRQLTEVWELDATSDLGGGVLPALRAAVLRAAHREERHDAVEMPTVDVSASAHGGTLQRVFGTSQYLSLDWYLDGLARARTVARVSTKYYSQGSGFLMHGGDLSDALRGRRVLLTNAHVVGDHTELYASFEAAASPGVRPTRHRLGRTHWISAPDRLDAAVLELDGAGEVTDADCCAVADRLPDAERRDRVYIIGYPLGAPLSFSLQDNHYLGHDASRLHYRTPTSHGSSGSPVFDASWSLVGVHHSGDHAMRRPDGGGAYEANAGSSIHAIRAAIATELRPPA